MNNFDRQYRLSAGVPGRKGFEVGSTDFSHKTALHISFSIEKSDTESSNTGKIILWNLSPAQLATLNLQDCEVILKAGYGTVMPLAFVGNITNAITDLDGADTMTEIEAVDSRVALRDTYISVSYKGIVSTKKILMDVAEQMGVPVVFSQKAEFVNLKNGFSYVGAARNALKKACSSNGLVWSLQNGVLQVKKPNEPISTRAFLLSAETGLIGIPKRLTKASETSSKDNGNKTVRAAQTGWQVRYFMNAAINVNDYVRLESKVATGDFRVSKLTIDGDNIEGEWTCTAELLEVK